LVKSLRPSSFRRRTARGPAHEDVQRFDGYQPTEEDHPDFARHQAQLIGQFLIDREAIVRWTNIQTKTADDFPTAATILAAIR
jgi:hypothetical protein